MHRRVVLALAVLVALTLGSVPLAASARRCQLNE